MRRVILPMRMTLDGFATGPLGEMDWLPFEHPELGTDHWEELFRRLRSTDTFLLGRATYQVWERFWPAASRDPTSRPEERRFARLAERVRKVVFSGTLRSVAWANARLATDPAEEVRRLRSRPGKDLALMGGATLARSFVRLGLVDDYLLSVDPILLGRGRRLFEVLNQRIPLRLIGSRTFASGAVQLHYRPADEATHAPAARPPGRVAHSHPPPPRRRRT
jgi:dihydrofolate reductase